MNRYLKLFIGIWMLLASQWGYAGCSAVTQPLSAPIITPFPGGFYAKYEIKLSTIDDSETGQYACSLTINNPSDAENNGFLVESSNPSISFKNFDNAAECTTLKAAIGIFNSPPTLRLKAGTALIVGTCTAVFNLTYRVKPTSSPTVTTNTIFQPSFQSFSDTFSANYSTNIPIAPIKGIEKAQASCTSSIPSNVDLPSITLTDATSKAVGAIITGKGNKFDIQLTCPLSPTTAFTLLPIFTFNSAPIGSGITDNGFIIPSVQGSNTGMGFRIFNLSCSSMPVISGQKHTGTTFTFNPSASILGTVIHSYSVDYARLKNAVTSGSMQANLVITWDVP